MSLVRFPPPPPPFYGAGANGVGRKQVKVPVNNFEKGVLSYIFHNLQSPPRKPAPAGWLPLPLTRRKRKEKDLGAKKADISLHKKVGKTGCRNIGFAKPVVCMRGAFHANDGKR